MRRKSSKLFTFHYLQIVASSHIQVCYTQSTVNCKTFLRILLFFWTKNCQHIYSLLVATFYLTEWKSQMRKQICLSVYIYQYLSTCLSIHPCIHPSSSYSSIIHISLSFIHLNFYELLDQFLWYVKILCVKVISCEEVEIYISIYLRFLKF